MRQVHAFFGSYASLLTCDSSAVTGQALSSETFCDELKAMFFALSTRLLFDFDVGANAIKIAQASNVIEDVRSRLGTNFPVPEHQALDGRERSARMLLRQLAEGITRHLRQPLSSDLSYAVQETLLNAAVPLAYAFTWTLLLLGRHPAMQARVRANGVLHGNSGSFDESDELCVAVVREALRLYPPAWALERTCTSTLVLAGATIRPGDAVVVSPYALHRMRSLWNRPCRFHPQRFEAGRVKGYAFIPFGGGAKTCPAARWNVPFLVMGVQSFLGRFSVRTSAMPHALPLVALRPSLDFAVSLRQSGKE
jgi:cytochrome P450